MFQIKSKTKRPNKFALSKNWVLDRTHCWLCALLVESYQCFQKKKKSFQFCLRISNKLLNAYLFILSAKLLNG